MVQRRGERNVPKAGWGWLPRERGEQQKLGEDFAVLLTVKNQEGTNQERGGGIGIR